MKKAFGRLKQKLAVDLPISPGLTGPPPCSADADLTFLHGHLIVRIIEAKNVDKNPSTGLRKKLERALATSMDGIDPYCTLRIGYNSYMRTDVVENNPNPVWNMSSAMHIAHEVDAIEIRVKSEKRTGILSAISKVLHLSMLSIPAAELKQKKRIAGWFPLSWYRREVSVENPHDDNSSDSDTSEEEHDPREKCDLGQIHIDIVYTPIEDYVKFPVAQMVGLMEAYYPIRDGVNAEMYQDADVPPGTLPMIPFRYNWQHGRCWIDVANAIMNASQFVYITGWAVWPELKMVRTHHHGDQWQNLTLGDMLKMKAMQGVTVCVMVWDEVVSTRIYAGYMATHDEELIDYFKDTGVHAVKASRKNDKNGVFAHLNDTFMFTHHQKTVITSCFDEAVGKNRLQAFVGGLDLTDGRYDNPQHSLFRTLRGIHEVPDFWQACALDVGAQSGPREPWHDIHCRVTGAAAWDVLENFEARWRRQAGSRLRDKLFIADGATASVDDENMMANGPWSVQILRSINQSSADIDLDRPGVVVRSKALIDSSIHDAYIHQIRRAKSHIVLENQYFLGSSHMWKRTSQQRGGFSNHLIAIELAEKICAKIRAGQRFVVYLTVPMFPEGKPASGAVQEILAHQRKTVNLITTRIRATLDEVGSNTVIEDWFAMFCLVNRESAYGGQGNGGTNEVETALSASRRFMIYVHSKFAVFDDEVAIIGSANINTRSMDGSRDSEIAAMCWQREHRASGPTAYGDDVRGATAVPMGDVAAFRCSVFAEHLGGYYREFEQPSSLQCVRKVRELARRNWDAFALETTQPQDLPHGHLATYPYQFGNNGEIVETDAAFPDFPGAKIIGYSSPIPNLLTG